MHTHIQAFQAKHNVGYRTLALLTLLALETNTLAALGMGQQTFPFTDSPSLLTDMQLGSLNGGTIQTNLHTAYQSQKEIH
jgi:hypothetical protein